MKDISELQKQIGTYGKTREIYAQYRKLTGRKRENFYEQHSSEITACQAAKRYFDSLGLKPGASAPGFLSRLRRLLLPAGREKSSTRLLLAVTIFLFSRHA